MREDSEGLRRLGPQDYPDDARGEAAARRDTGLRQTRRLTAWTAAGLIAGVAASVGYFVHHPATSASSGSGAVVSSTGAAVHGQKPAAGHALVVSGGSGVTAGVAGGGGGSTTGGLTWHDN